MKIAILGCDTDVERLVRAAVHDRRHDVVALLAADEWRERLRPLVPRAVWSNEWESLLATTDVDAVVVGRERDAGAGPEALKKLVQAGVPLLVIHPVGDPLLALELEMIRRDGQGPLVAHYPGCRHPAIGLLRSWIVAGSEGPLGAVEQIVFERSLSNRQRSSVIFQLARDADIVRTLLGNISKVNAMGPSPDAETWNNLSVQLAGREEGGGAALARWSVEPAEGESRGRLTLIGVRGRAVLSMPSSPSQWSLEVAGDPDSPREWPAWDGEAAALDLLDQTRRGGACEPDWTAVCRDLEAADTVELSLRRGRLIELHHETVTEEDTFKGVMAALGCLLLMLVPLVLVVAAMLEGLTSRPRISASAPSVSVARAEDATGGAVASPETDRRESARPIWPFFLLAPLLVFLTLQVLRLVFASRSAPPRASPEHR